MERTMQKRRIFIFDTTLRDGEQSPGASMNADEKLRMARQLESLGVDVIEAGFPASYEGDFQSVRTIAAEIRGVQIAAIARAKPGDIDRAWEAIQGAANPRLHVFLSSSDIHLKHQLKKTRDEVLHQARTAVKRARAYINNVEFTAMDATRADLEFLCSMLAGAISSGATTVNIADTVGYAVPGEFGALAAYLLENVNGMADVVFSVHCHDDLGLAVANTLAAIEYGAQQVKCTVNGIGERAGNAALEEVVAALKTRNDFYKVRTGIRTEQLYETSQLLTEITGLAVQSNKAVVGANAFAHEAGIHQDGLIKEKSTYEIMTPESVGAPETRVVLGRHSGRHALEERLKKMGYVLSNDEVDNVFAQFKAWADRDKRVSEKDLETILCRHGFCKPMPTSKHGSDLRYKGKLYTVNERDKTSPL
jgi:2-isopropylmalate synthase